MTFDDMMTVEQHVADLVSGTGRQLPVMLSKKNDRVDIDAKGLSSTDACALVDRLAQSLSRKGYLWDVWMSLGVRRDDQVIHVSERETEED